MRPFKYGRVVSGVDFCGRKKAIETLTDYINSSQNVVIQGERRIGKTSLIVETAINLKNKRLMKIDLAMLKSSHDLCQRIIKAIFHLESTTGILNRTLKAISHLRPQIGMDPFTNLPTVSFDSTVKMSYKSLEEVFDLIQNLGKKNNLIVFFDEFQDILSMEDSKESIAVLRSKIQYHETITYLFAGSIRNLMDEIFNSHDSPLFKSAIPITLGAIDQKEFFDFIKEKYLTGNRNISVPLFEKIYNFCDGITGDIQQFCDALWDITENGDELEEIHFSDAFNLIFSREHKSYELIINDLTEIQMRCMIGLAKTDGTAPTSSSFLRLTGIQQPGTIKRSIEKLQKRRVIFKYENKYRFINPFFKSWLLSSGL